MIDVLSVFRAFFAGLDSKNKRYFFASIFLSALAGFFEAALFEQLSELLDGEEILSQEAPKIILFLVARFLFLFVAIWFVSQGAASVTAALMRSLIFNGESEKPRPEQLTQVVLEAERIGMGYFLAWQNLLSNAAQMLFLVGAAFVVAPIEAVGMAVFLVPLYLGFSQATLVNVTFQGEKRMHALRSLTRVLSQGSESSQESTDLITKAEMAISRVRIWSLSQKPTLELLGVLSLGAAAVAVSFWQETSFIDLAVNFGLLATICLRALPYLNQVQNAVTLISSIHGEVESYNATAHK